MGQPGRVEYAASERMPTVLPGIAPGGSQKKAASPAVSGRQRSDAAQYGESGNDAEASCDALTDHGRTVRPRGSRRDLASSGDVRKTERRRSSGRRQGAPAGLALMRADADEQAVDDQELVDASAPRARRARVPVRIEVKSRLRAFCEALLFLVASVAVMHRLSALGRDDVRAKLPEVGLLVTLSFLCFATHLNATCTVWATRVRYLRKTDMSDALYSMLLMPLLACVYLADGMPHDPPRPLAPAVFGTASGAPWRAGFLPMPGVPQSAEDVVRGRRAMLDVYTLFGLVIGLHILGTTWHRKQSKRQGLHLQIENMPGGTVFAYYIAFALGVTALIALLKGVLSFCGWKSVLLGDLTITQVAVDAILFQLGLYAWTRVARQNFTLGELSIACTFNTTLILEAIILTMYKLAPVPELIVAYRTPSVVYAYQLALIVGMMLVGLVLSPLLALSRVLAQRPTHRLRWPDKRNLHRRLLSLGFFVFLALIVFGTLGPWVWWMLGRRNPWLFIARFTLQGPYWWLRLALLGYWGVLCNIALLSLQLMVNRVWQYATVGDQVQAQAIKRRGARSDSVTQVPPNRTASQRAASSAVSRLAAPRADNEATALGPALAVNVNVRRKFFHMLAVLLFVPGLAWDPAFMHLAFAAAFALFVFGEYLRYCAVYPVGASLHFFLSQFLDSKDSGLVILSHLYLLSGCAAATWLETRSALLLQYGVVLLGVGDSCASLVGRRYGRLHWPRSAKTVEGSLAFFVSVVAAVLLLRLVRMIEPLYLPNVLLNAVLLSAIEGISEQNDNLVLPISGLLLGSLLPMS
ncbi:hypothetical protein CBS9595_001728 [Malassezia furfur]|nr:hypothetical protein CBS9595_001728 [Malassezia furfur]